jgi:hypothetical protein
MVTTGIPTKGFCGSCDGFTGGIPCDLVDMDEIAYTMLYLQNRQPIITPGDVERLSQLSSGAMMRNGNLVERYFC